MDKNREEKVTMRVIIIMVIIGIAFYFLPGKWISLESDSVAYLYAASREGVLPGYPIFLGLFRVLLGEDYFLHGVVVVQCIIAIGCTLIFVLSLQKKFCLMGWECILLYVITMLPFSIYLPEVGITHQIMTEGLTYAIFYLFFLMILKSIWTLKYRWYIGSLAIAFLLGTIRSQMLFLQAVCYILLIWMIMQKNRCRLIKRMSLCFAGAVVGILFAMISYKSIYAVNYFYQENFAVRTPVEDEQINHETQQPSNTEIRETVIEETEIAIEDQRNSQFDSLIIARGFFEADREDVALFEDEMMKEIFLRTYQLANEGEHLYRYAKKGLYMWQDLVYDRMAELANQAILEYDQMHPGMRDRTKASIMRELGLRILFAHFDRYVYHVIRLMMPSFIASVFFQIKPIYLLCHFIALLIYLFAILGAWWIRKNGGSKDVSEYVIAIVLTIIVMVVIINIVFMGLQRYVVYGMGIFYCAMYLQLKEICLILKEKMRKREINICRKRKKF